MDSTEERLVATLRVHADGEVDTVALLHGATTSGRRLRRRRQAGVLASTAAGVVGVLGLASMVVGGLPVGDGGGAPVGAAPSPSHSSPFRTSPHDGWTELPMPPAVEGEPTAVEDPRVVGAPGGLVHLSFDTLPRPYSSVSYGVLAGDRRYEFANLKPALPDDRLMEVWLHNDKDRLENRTQMPRKSVRVGDEPAKLYSDPTTGALAVRWQPAPGLWAEVFEPAPGDTPAKTFAEADDVLSVAEVVRVDQVTRCTGPARLDYVPDGAFLSGCSIDFSINADPDTQLILRHDNGAKLSLVLPDDPEDHFPHEEPNLKVAGRPAYWMPQEPGNDHGHLEVYGIKNGKDLAVDISGGFTKQDAIKVVEGLEFAEDLGDPATWPTDPLA